jgi:hypothetical protein
MAQSKGNFGGTLLSPISGAESTQVDGETVRTVKHETRDLSTNLSVDVPNTDEIESANADGSHSKITSVAARAKDGCKSSFLYVK